MSTILSYVFDGEAVKSADGSHPLAFPDAAVVTGPGPVGDEEYPSALALGSASASVAVDDLALGTTRFHVRVVFRFTADLEGRENLVESDHVPFALFLQRRDDGVSLEAATKPTHGIWGIASTRFSEPLTPGAWTVADLVYDTDTLAVFVDGQIADVQAWPDGAVTPIGGTHLYVGSWVDGAKHHFTGALAALTVADDVPAGLEAQLDEHRTHPRWYITRKANERRGVFNVGGPTGPVTQQPGTGAHVQPYAAGLLMFHPQAGDAFEMHGAILARYRDLAHPESLGFLVSDEEKAADPRGRKSLFSRGAIYWSSKTGAWPVDGRLYLGFESATATDPETGAAEVDWSPVLGFPTGAPTAVPGGRQLVLERGRMYHRDGAPAAHEVHGAILNRFIATGGTAKWGFPVSNETPVTGLTGKPAGRRSEFERCVFYWSAKTGAHEVHGDIARKYHDVGGPVHSRLGFPTSDERDAPGGRYNTFSDGAICWYGCLERTHVAHPFRLHLGTLDTRDSEGTGMDDNDLYVKVTVTDGRHTLLDKEHFPKTGSWSNRNVIDADTTIERVVSPVEDVTVTVEVWEADDWPLSDDHLGTWSVTLGAGNAWGFADRSGVIDSGRFGKVNNLRLSVLPDVDPGTFSEADKWWAVKNRGTDVIPMKRYAEAFADVSTDPHAWRVLDNVRTFFYDHVVKTLGDGGNCVGMSLEGIYARKGRSAFGLPLDRFADWDLLEESFNVKHQYQVGAGAIWWFLGQFVTGKTHSPKKVFAATKAAHDRGEDPVLCLAQHYDFSGAPHCILPVAWHTDGDTWQIDVLDPNFPRTGPRPLTVDAGSDTFRYQGAGSSYSGGAWSGGRLHYLPFSVLDEPPRTPLWDAIVLLLSGVVLILGDGAETESITDLDGNDLDAHGSRATDELKAGTVRGGVLRPVPWDEHRHRRRGPPRRRPAERRRPAVRPCRPRRYARRRPRVEPTDASPPGRRPRRGRPRRRPQTPRRTRRRRPNVRPAAPTRPGRRARPARRISSR